MCLESLPPPPRLLTIAAPSFPNASASADQEAMAASRAPDPAPPLPLILFLVTTTDQSDIGYQRTYPTPFASL
jgi:hypothetical protein